MVERVGRLCATEARRTRLDLRIGNGVWKISVCPEMVHSFCSLKRFLRATRLPRRRVTCDEGVVARDRVAKRCKVLCEGLGGTGLSTDPLAPVSGPGPGNLPDCTQAKGIRRGAPRPSPASGAFGTKGRRAS